MIDLHAHVLPGLDDGPRTMPEAVALVRAAERAGIEVVVATPHLDRHWDVHVEGIAAALTGLREALREAGVGVEVLGGGEIALARLIDLRPAELERLTLGGGRTLLVECPRRRLPGDFTWPIRQLLADGWGVLLAHPERSPAFQSDFRTLQQLVDAGAHAQVTAAALVGDFGALPRQAALRMLDAGLADVVATDAHDLRRRPPVTRAALTSLRAALPAAAERWDALTRITPAMLLGRSVGLRLPDAA